VDGNLAGALCKHEEMLADVVRSLACELRLIEVGDLINYIQNQSFANLQDLVNSSAELYFRSGTLQFGWGANVFTTWANPPAISVDLEFRNLGVTVFFALMLKSDSAAVSIHDICFDVPGQGRPRKTDLLALALSDARLVSGRDN
jgi:hypothetical protein